jgi:hypothetical protein
MRGMSRLITVWTLCLMALLQPMSGRAASGTKAGSAHATPGYRNSAAKVARVLGVSLGTVQEIRSLNLEATLSYILMMTCDNGACSGADLLKDRASMHWGEVVKAHGKDWGTLAAEVRKATLSGALDFEPATRLQGERSGRNHPETARDQATDPASSLGASR